MLGMYGADRRKRMIVCSAVLGLSLTLVGCGHSKKAVFQGSPDATEGGIGLNLRKNSDDGLSGAVAVNAYLWRASLDTVAFMPLASADPFGGVIITEWYTPPETPEERFKVDVYILGRALRADGLKVSVFRQTRDPQGKWSDAAVGPEVATQFEDAVLTRARQLRLQAVSEKS
jgi:hypothetical protein